jgi:hypothetical protein
MTEAKHIDYSILFPLIWHTYSMQQMFYGLFIIYEYLLLAKFEMSEEKNPYFFKCRVYTCAN